MAIGSCCFANQEILSEHLLNSSTMLNSSTIYKLTKSHQKRGTIGNIANPTTKFLNHWTVVNYVILRNPFQFNQS